MQAQAIPPAVMAGIAFYVASYQLLIHFRRKGHPEHLSFGLSCLAVGVYDVFCAGLYDASSVAEGAPWQHAQYAALALVAPALIWFVAHYSGQVEPRVLRGWTSLYAVLAAIQIADRSQLTLRMDVPSVKRVDLPAGLVVTYYEATPGIVTHLQTVLGVVVMVYILRLAVRAYRAGRRGQAVPLLVALGLFAGTVLNDTLVSSGVYGFVYLIEYGYMAIVVLMAYSLSSTVVEAAAAKEVLRATEERFRSLVENAPTGILIVTDAYAFSYVNDELCRILGHSRAEIIGHDFRDFLDEESRSLVADRYVRRRRGEAVPARYEFNIVRKDGEKRRVELSSAVMGDSHGNLHTIGQLLDVTERKRAEDALREKTAELDRYFTNALDLLCIADTDGYFRRLNREWESTLGYPIEELEGTRFLDYVHPEDRDPSLTAISTLEEGREVLNFVNRYRGKDGAYRWIEWRSSAVGKVIYAAARDITKRREVEAERERLIVELEQRNAELERFTYTVSHDLKSPLVTIAGFLGYLRRDAAAGNVEKVGIDIDRIAQAVERMQRLLQELLELSRVGRVMNPPEAVESSALVGAARRQVQGSLEARGVRVEVAPDLPPVYGDRVRLVEVFQNLLDNACKFMGAQAAPSIAVGHQGQDRDGKPILFVRDNGIGIEPRYHSRVFGLFDKLDPGSEGTGIGLALVKRIVEAHGGRVWVESAPGEGSTFYFTLQAPPPAEPHPGIAD